VRSGEAIEILIALSIPSLLVGCGGDVLFSPPQEVIEIVGIIPEREQIYPGDVIGIRAQVEYTGSSRLTYRWSASGGAISPTGREVTYIAPDEPGEYEISLVVEGESAVDHATITITVIPPPQHRVPIAEGLYFPHDLLEGILKFKVRVDELFGPVRLRYHVIQVNDQFDSILSIHIDGKKLISEPIGQAFSGGEAKGALDLTDIVRAPGIYLFRFSIKPANRVEKGWMLKEAVLENAEGEVIG